MAAELKDLPSRTLSVLNGIRVKSSENTITSNTFQNNAQGIFLDSAMKNTIYGNNITNSSQVRNCT